MPSPATAQRRSIREVVRIGQVWQHDGTEFPIHIKQIHRADRLVEAWRDGPEGREKHGITFTDLQREYDLIDSGGVGAPRRSTPRPSSRPDHPAPGSLQSA